MKKYIKCESQITADKLQRIFDFITQEDPKFDATRDQLIPKIRVWTKVYDPACATIFLTLPEELKDYLKNTKPFHKRNQASLQDFAQMLYRWSGLNTPAVHIYTGVVGRGCDIYYINSLDMILVPFEDDGYDRRGYWTKYLITAVATNEFIIGYKVFSDDYRDRGGYMMKNGSTIMKENIPAGASKNDNAYLALGVGGPSNYTCVIDFLEKYGCFKY